MIDREDQVLLECPYGGRLGKFASRFEEVGGDVAKRRVRRDRLLAGRCAVERGQDRRDEGRHLQSLCDPRRRVEVEERSDVECGA